MANVASHREPGSSAIRWSRWVADLLFQSIIGQEIFLPLLPVEKVRLPEILTIGWVRQHMFEDKATCMRFCRKTFMDEELTARSGSGLKVIIRSIEAKSALQAEEG